jgi:glycine cleavage system H protein
MSYPENLRYTTDHEWARLEDDGTLTVGITAHAQEALGDVVYVELPEVGSALEAEANFGVVESVKAVSDLLVPCNGTVAAVNEALEDAPEVINADPYGAGWIMRLKPERLTDFEALMDATAYAAFVEAEAG